ncbi:hypothetical protein L6164_022835 [Bauhinia variegata]|uniref:Uncharacterized protein n=1 Tax=Bauhinia variegata TaxID=167791 RepID=A0ACB9MGP8_BAUVA|nr:hypothetical protein L6164_022835 [Bauhinia variegata]
MAKSSSTALLGFAVAAVSVFSFLVNLAQAQHATAATDPSEARALNSIFTKWGISASTVQSAGWNISGELCSGTAIDDTTIDNTTYSPLIKCTCSFNNDTTCRIAALKVYALDVSGEIPEELWTLTYLTNLNLGQNYLTGSLPPAIGNLTRMQYLSFYINALSGELPKELGNLTELIELGFGSNRFNGPLPSELGKLVKLEKLYMDSSGVSGPIPSTFKNLINLRIVWASDVDFTGRIPDFIGNWTKLEALWFQGNSFEGSIPNSFSNLTSMMRLGISGLSNGSSTLEFIRNMKSLTKLELRNDNISGPIPSYIGEFSGLTQLTKHQRGDDKGLLGIDTKLCTFSYLELRNATNDFNLDNKLGEGGFGQVYKGTLNDGRVIAVKQLHAGSHQGTSQFINEITTISAVQHRNLVELYGCCIEGDKRLIVYEYLENKSLDQALFGNCLNLNWTTRYNICVGVARGLAYLHEESRLRIVHRDVKSSNILLDYALVPKISDFGLAKLYDNEKTHISTQVAGTIGYLAPEYALRGSLTEKADVFSFGVVVLEIICGRRNSDLSLEEEKVYLLEWAWNLFENNRVIELVDPRLSEFNEEEVKRIVGVALLCTQTSPALRPSMSRVVAMLSGDIEVGPVTSRPVYFTDWNFDDATSLMADVATNGANTSYYISASTNSSVVGSAEISQMNSKPIIDSSIGKK